MKKQYIFILITFIIMFIISYFQLFDVMLITSMKGLPPDITLKDIQEQNYRYILIVNTGIFILISFLILLISKIFTKIKKK